MALAMILLFLGAAIFGRVYLHYRETGDFGIRPARPEASVSAKISSGLVILVFAGLLLVSLAAHQGYLHDTLTLSSIWKVAGTLICIAGILLTCIAQQQMGAEWRMGVDPSEKTRLITHGLYAHIRNPIYSGIMLFGLGMFPLLPHWITAVLLVIGYLSIELHVRRVEEPYLRKLHGQAYGDYQQTAGRYLPLRRRA